MDHEDEIRGRSIRNTEAECKWGKEALELLENYYQLEDPRFVPQPNPIENEIWVQANLSLDPTNGSTGSNPKPCSDQEENDGKEDRFLVRGIVDRLDYVAVLSSARDVFNQSGNHNGEKAIMTAVRIMDYKTGTAPKTL